MGNTGTEFEILETSGKVYASKDLGSPMVTVICARLASRVASGGSHGNLGKSRQTNIRKGERKAWPL